VSSRLSMQPNPAVERSYAKSRATQVNSEIRQHEKERQMAVRIVKLGTPRIEGEGTRIGTVRRPPRGVPKSEFSSGNWYDVWYPNLSPSVETMKLGQSAETPEQWRAFEKKYKSEMNTSENSRTIELLATLSKHANFSVGCYCDDESHCHRSILRLLLK